MQKLVAGELVLEPLVAAHAEAMFGLLCAPAIYRYLDEAPPASVEQLRATYRRREARRSPDGTQHWLNWVVRQSGGPPIGYVQATVFAGGSCSIGFVFGTAFHGRGFATRATQAMVEHLRSVYGVARVLATIEIANDKSIRLVQRLGFRDATPEESLAQRLSATERLFVGT